MYVNWGEVMEFCRKLTERERRAGRVPDGWEYTLPTDAQWERGCRAGTVTRYSFGDDESKLAEYAWFLDPNAETGEEEYVHRVGQKKPNPWGLHDIYGNAWEWCRDWHTSKPPGGRDPEVTDRDYDRVLEDYDRVVRGGGWGSSEGQCRSAFRSKRDPSLRSGDLGFRVALCPSGKK